MLPYSEMDNYKLQMQLLEEKLLRSEENRKKLEHKLEHAKQKKSEQEKIVRARQREKYQEFLGELEKRNERNRQLMKMLERVDQQTAALSARSERLRMMKMQYEMYFAKLVQNQTMRCIQASTPAATATTFLPTAANTIPVLLPTGQAMQQQSSVMTTAPIKNNEHEPLTSTSITAPILSTVQPATTAIYQCDPSGNLIAAGTASTPVAYTPSPRTHTSEIASTCNTIAQPTAILPALAASTQHWTLAMATPTPAGMLLTSNPTATNASTAAAATLNLGAIDYVTTTPTYDYMQYPLGYQPRMRHLLQQKPNMSIYADESDDLLPTMEANTTSDRYHRRYMENDNNNTNKTTNNDNQVKGREIESSNRKDLPTRQLDNDKISEVKAAAATTITTATNKCIDNERQSTQQLLSDMSPTFSATSLTVDKLPKTMTMTEHDTALASTPIDDAKNDVEVDKHDNDEDDNGKKPKDSTRFDEFSKGINIIEDKNKGALSIQRNEEEKSLAHTMQNVDTTTIEPTTVISNDNESFIEENRRQKINMEKAWQQQHMTQSWQPAESTVTTSGDDDNTLKLAEMTAGFREYAKNKVENNGSKNSSDNTTSKLSIEKIENEIYGELVNPPLNEVNNANARNAAQELVGELVTQPKSQQENQEPYHNTITSNDKNTTEYANYVQEAPNSNSQSNSESYDPAYAALQATTNVEVYPTTSDENAYTPSGTTAEYAQYDADPNAMQLQQDYTNVNYTNYDATQYTTDGAYDPNIYPGYTYDETTGQYTADPEYIAADGTNTYAEQQQAYDQQQYDAIQQDVNYDYSNYEQPSANVQNTEFTDTNAVTTQPQNEAQNQPSNFDETTVPITPTKMSNNKPTSILSSGDKHASNEAQKRKKRVNFVDSSETDDSSSVKQTGLGGNVSGAANESDFDFSASEKSGGGDSSSGGGISN